MSNFFLMISKCSTHFGKVLELAPSEAGYKDKLLLLTEDGHPIAVQKENAIHTSEIENWTFNELTKNVQLAMFKAVFLDGVEAQYLLENRWTTQSSISKFIGFKGNKNYRLVTESFQQKEIKDIREQMGILSERLKELEKGV